MHIAGFLAAVCGLPQSSDLFFVSSCWRSASDSINRSSLDVLPPPPLTRRGRPSSCCWTCCWSSSTYPWVVLLFSEKPWVVVFLRSFLAGSRTRPSSTSTSSFGQLLKVTLFFCLIFEFFIGHFSGIKLIESISIIMYYIMNLFYLKYYSNKLNKTYFTLNIIEILWKNNQYTKQNIQKIHSTNIKNNIKNILLYKIHTPC